MNRQRTFALKKGETVILPKTQYSKKLQLQLEWKSSSEKVDLDASCVMVNRTKGEKVDLVFFGKKDSTDKSVSLSGDNHEEVENITVHLDTVSKDVTDLFFAVACYSNSSLKKLVHADVKLVTPSGDIFCQYDLTQFEDYKAVIMSRVFRENDSWSFQAIGLVSSGETADELWRLQKDYFLGLKPFKRIAVECVAGRNLAIKDTRGTSDPYCVVKFANKTEKNKYISRNLNPVWNSKFEFTNPQGKWNDINVDHYVKIQVFDHDTLSADDFMGHVEIDISKLESGQKLDEWFTLQPDNLHFRGEEVKGDIHVIIQKFLD